MSLVYKENFVVAKVSKRNDFIEDLAKNCKIVCTMDICSLKFIILVVKISEMTVV